MCFMVTLKQPILRLGLASRRNRFTSSLEQCTHPKTILSLTYSRPAIQLIYNWYHKILEWFYSKALAELTHLVRFTPGIPGHRAPGKGKNPRTSRISSSCIKAAPLQNHSELQHAKSSRFARSHGTLFPQLATNLEGPLKVLWGRYNLTRTMSSGYSWGSEITSEFTFFQGPTFRTSDLLNQKRG